MMARPALAAAAIVLTLASPAPSSAGYAQAGRGAGIIQASFSLDQVIIMLGFDTDRASWPTGHDLEVRAVDEGCVILLNQGGPYFDMGCGPITIHVDPLLRSARASGTIASVLTAGEGSLGDSTISFDLQWGAPKAFPDCYGWSLSEGPRSAIAGTRAPIAGALTSAALGSFAPVVDGCLFGSAEAEA